MSNDNHSAFVAAKDYLYQCESLTDAKALDALNTIWGVASDAGSVTVEIRTVSRADRRGDKTTKFASDIRYARVLYDIAPLMVPVLIARVRELESQLAHRPTPPTPEREVRG